MPAHRTVPDQAFWLGCHTFCFGRLPPGERIEVDKHVLPVVKRANELNFGGADSAVLYRFATDSLGQAMRKLELDTAKFPLQTKALRSLGFAALRREQQPADLTRSMPQRCLPWTDQWNTGASAVEDQVGSEMRAYGCLNLHGVALHDPPDKRQQVGLDWKVDISPALKRLKRLRDAGLVGRIGLGVKTAAFVSEFVHREPPGTLNYAGVTFSTAVLHEFWELLALAREHGFTITLMGIYFGGAFVLEKDPVEQSFIYNYEEAAPRERARMKLYYDVCVKHGVTLKELAAASAGILAANYPTIVNQIVVSSLTPDRLDETRRLVREAEIPPAMWRELKDMELIPEEFPES